MKLVVYKEYLRDWPWKVIGMAAAGAAIIAVVVVALVIHLHKPPVHPAQISKTTPETPQQTSKTPDVASLQPIPRGVFTNWASASSAQRNAILQDADVIGVGTGSVWQILEPTSNKYDWSTLDADINVLRGHKKILLRITSGGQNTPSWVMSQSRTFSFTDTNSYHKTSGQSVTIPVFWDPAFLATKKQMIQATAAHLSGKQIDIVAASCANATTNDWNPASKTQVEYNEWLSLGYTADKLIGACDQIIDTTADAFPNSYISVSVGNSGLFDTSPNYIASSVLRHAKAKYPGRIIVEKNALSATTPAPGSSRPAARGRSRSVADSSWQIILDNRPNVSGQMLWDVSGQSSCRMNGGRSPCDPATELAAAISTGAQYGMKYEEIYTSDVLNPALSNVIKQANSLLMKN